MIQKLEEASELTRRLFENCQKIANQRSILQALEFDKMEDRYQTVSEAADKTFKWIFEDPDMLRSRTPYLRLSFQQWLESGDGVFHIAGKLGSGKSTLMKFLCEDEATIEALRRWAGTKPLVFAVFFFWKRGTALQKSLMGLMRSLLFSVLNEFPEIIESVLQQYWKPTEYEP